MTEPGLTVFAPVYNEADILEPNTLRLLEHLESLNLGAGFEFIIGSNGSTDATPEKGRALEARLEPVRFFHLAHKGVGAAFGEAVRMARFDRFVTVDMDLSIDMAFIQQAFRMLEDCDIVIGSKVMGQQHRPFLRVFVSNLFIRLARILLGIGFHDYSIAAKGYRTAVARAYLPYVDPLTFYVVLLVYYAHHDGRTIREIPVSCVDRRGSRFNLLHEGIYKFGNLFLLWMSRVLG